MLHVHIHSNTLQFFIPTSLPFYRPSSQWCLALLRNILACYTNLLKKQ